VDTEIGQRTSLRLREGPHPRCDQQVEQRSRQHPSGKPGRVGAAFARRASHRAGRAQLRHPVRQRAGSQRGRHTSAEAGRAPQRLSSAVTVTGNGASEGSTWFPALGPPVGSALPFTGSSEASSPAATVLWRCATSCAPLAALRCLRLAIPCRCACRFAPIGPRRQTAGQGLVIRSPPAGL